LDVPLRQMRNRGTPKDPERLPYGKATQEVGTHSAQANTLG